MMHPVAASLGRAIISQLHVRMLLLSILPFMLSVVIWGAALWVGLQPMIDWLHEYFANHGGFAAAGDVLNRFGLGAIKTILVPLMAMWVLLPLMILTALIFVGIMAMPIIVRHVSSRSYPHLEMRRGGSLWGGLWIGLWSFLIFVVLWLITLPLTILFPPAFIVQPLLWGWLTYRVMAYDALADHATPEERKDLLHIHRWPLLLIGTIAGAMGAAPTLLWLGGALAVIFFPILAAGAIWLYVLVFIFTGLWFEHYCLDALSRYRAGRPPPSLPPIDGVRLPDHRAPGPRA